MIGLKVLLHFLIELLHSVLKSDYDRIERLSIYPEYKQGYTLKSDYDRIERQKSNLESLTLIQIKIRL